jgi:phosphoinositide-3-kinase, regulatory subunit 4
MLAVDPTARPTFDRALHAARGSVFPECFYSFLHTYVAGVNELPSPSPFHQSTASASVAVAATAAAAATLTSPVIKPSATSSGVVQATAGDDINSPLPTDSDRRIEKVWADFESVEPYLVPEKPEGKEDEPNVEYVSSEIPIKGFKVCIALPYSFDN